MDVALRRAAVGLLIFMWCGLLGVMLSAVAGGWGGPTIPVVGAGLAIVGLLAAATWRGWSHGHVAAIVVAIALAAGAPPDSDLDRGNTLTLLIPAIVALIVGRSWWIVGATAAACGLFLLRSGGQSLAAVNPADIVVFGMLVGGLWFGRWIIERALAIAHEHAQHADAAGALATARAHELAEANQRLETQLAEQQALLNLVVSLEVPAIALADGVLLVPLIGQIDRRRAEALAARLLRVVHQQRAGCVVLDLAGAASFDAVVAEALIATARALRLLGCQVMLSGITAQAASTLTGAGMQLDGVRVVRSPQDALKAIARQ